MLSFFTLGVSFLCVSNVYAAEKFDTPIVQSMQYFENQNVRVDVVVSHPTGKGEKALDFFLVDSVGQKIPNTLREIFKSSPFLEKMVAEFFEQGADVLTITEMISLPKEKGRVNGFVGLTKAEYESGHGVA